jgi:hypothetical protein
MREDGEEGSGPLAMSLISFIPAYLRALPRDGIVLFLTRFLRLFAYGALSVVLVFYLVSLNLSKVQVGLLLTLTLAGDGAISVFEQQDADHYNEIGRIPTVNGARTSFFSPDLERFYVAVRRQGSTAAQIQVYSVGQ